MNSTPLEKRRALSGPAIRGFSAIADLWGLKEADRLAILGQHPRTTYYRWMKLAKEHQDITLDFDVLVRISLILGIYGGLRRLHATEQEGVDWLKRPNHALTFAGRTPLDLITSGSQDDLYQVRRFIDGARGGLFLAPNEADRNFTPYTDDDIIF